MNVFLLRQTASGQSRIRWAYLPSGIRQRTQVLAIKDAAKPTVGFEPTTPGYKTVAQKTQLLRTQTLPKLRTRR